MSKLAQNIEAHLCQEVLALFHFNEVEVDILDDLDGGVFEVVQVYTPEVVLFEVVLAAVDDSLGQDHHIVDCVQVGRDIQFLLVSFAIIELAALFDPFLPATQEEMLNHFSIVMGHRHQLGGKVADLDKAALFRRALL